MSFSCVRISFSRVALLTGVVGMLATIVAPSTAEARRGVRARPAKAAVARYAYAPPFSSMVVDANTGKVMHAVSENELRHPASVTKVMTLYLLFEQIERGALKLDSELQVSKHAAAMAPSKLGLKPGETIEVEDAIKAIVTKSANDVAATIAENIAGSEEEFADRMTRKARQLGMTRTVYKNASGLPDRAQVTTARDLVILGRAIQERFPKLYRYFQTRSFEYADRVIGNHNRLLGRIDGVDGIKTGFTTASGFNLLTSARVGGRHVVGVVLGGRSGASRDKIMADLIRANIVRASTSGRSSVFAEAQAGGADGDEVASRSSSPDVETTGTSGADTKRRTAEAAPARTSVPASTAKATASITPPANASYASAALQPQPVTSTATPQKIEGRLPARPAIPDAPVRAEAAPPKAVAVAARAADVREPVAAQKTTSPSPWVIQLAAEDNEAKARDLLEQAKSSTGRALAKAAPFTEKVVRGNATLYRARFSGFAEADSAQEACRTLKTRGFACFATRS